MKHTKRNVQEHAVSPVVGVMLMLVVTIIIAAVVSAFSGSMVAGKEKAPQASLECHITWIPAATSMSGNAGPQFTMKHMGGDPISTTNVKLVTSWANATGEYHVQSTVAAVWGTTQDTYYTSSGTTGVTNYTLSSLNTHEAGFVAGSEEYYNVPYLVIPGQYAVTGDPAKDEPLWFGNYFFKAGDIIKADIDNTVVGTGPFQNQANPIIKDADLLTGNEIVNVKLIDLKSGTSIYDKDVIVEV